MDVLNSGGKQMAGLRTNIVTGAECVGRTPYEVYDSKPMVSTPEYRDVRTMITSLRPGEMPAG